MTFEEEVRSKLKKRGLSIPFVCEHIQISEYLLKKYMADENTPLYIEVGIIDAIDLIGLP